MPETLGDAGYPKQVGYAVKALKAVHQHNK
jgi:hypothetical protein